jgi:hypothetical protein
MPYDQELAGRVHQHLLGVTGIVEKKMFGGIGFLFHGNMACGVIGKNLIVRSGPGGYEAALAKPHTKPFDYIGRPMKGWIYVLPEGTSSAADLAAWVQLGLEFTRTLPAK